MPVDDILFTDIAVYCILSYRNLWNKYIFFVDNTIIKNNVGEVHLLRIVFGIAVLNNILRISITIIIVFHLFQECCGIFSRARLTFTQAGEG